MPEKIDNYSNAGKLRLPSFGPLPLFVRQVGDFVSFFLSRYLQVTER